MADFVTDAEGNVWAGCLPPWLQPGGAPRPTAQQPALDFDALVEACKDVRLDVDPVKLEAMRLETERELARAVADRAARLATTGGERLLQDFLEREPLYDAARRVHALLADGAEHSLPEVMDAAGVDQGGRTHLYRVTRVVGSRLQPLPWEVLVQARADGKGGGWYRLATHEVEVAAPPGETPPDTREDTHMTKTTKRPRRFELLDMKELSARRAQGRQPGEDDDDEGGGDDSSLAVVENLPAGGMKVLGYDSTEPEDANFGRHYNWVPGALEQVEEERRAVLALVREAFDRGLLDRSATGADNPEAQLWALVESLP